MAEQLQIPATSGGETFSDKLRAQAGDSWHRVTCHEFANRLAAGTLDPGAMARYLIQDNLFFDSFSALLASMIAAAPTVADRAPAAKYLARIMDEETTFFDRALAALGVPEDKVQQTPADPVTVRFIDLMHRAAGSKQLARMLAVLLGAEWSYQSWAERVSPSREAGLPFWCSEWIDLHSGSVFGSVVGYLRALLDRVAPLLPEEEVTAVRDHFLEAVALEADFFDAALRQEAPQAPMAAEATS